MSCTAKECRSTNTNRNRPEGRRQDQWSAMCAGDLSGEKQTRQDISALENECYQFPSNLGLCSVHTVTGGFAANVAVHRCSTRNRTPLLPVDDDAPGVSGTKQMTDDDHAVQCKECGRCFRRPGDMKRHKCKSERMRFIEDQRGAVWCSHCNRWFRSKGSLAVHKCRQSLPRAPEK